jgi:hypothetical protein
VTRPSVRFALALGIAVASAFWQRHADPTRPVSGRLSLSGSTIDLTLARTHGGPGDQPVRIGVPETDVTGEVAFRRYPTADVWTRLALAREGQILVAALPHQPPAGRLEYQVRLSRGGETAVFPPRPAVTTFKGDVPAAVLVPHATCMFLAVLLSTAAGLAALAGAPSRRLALAALACIGIGGFVLGSIVQKVALGAYWTGAPFGWDLADNRALVAGLFWLGAVLVQRPGYAARVEILAAAVTTLLVFAVPRAAWGSEIAWETLAKPG